MMSKSEIYIKLQRRQHILSPADDITAKGNRMASEVSDEQLAKLAQQGDRDAFLKLYDRFLKRVFNRVKSKIPPSDVEDVTQEIFIAVVRSLESYQQRSRFSTWLYTIVNRQIADFYRKRSRQAEKQSVGLDTVDHFLTAPEDENIDQHIMVQRELNQLPEHYQEVILARFADGLTFAEIAEDRGQSLEATKSLYRRAIQALRDRIDGD
jgi:RNA polymerase sigma-70 factor (ECF subfamily)